MTAKDPAFQEAAPDSPALVVVDADRQARVAAESALARRFGADYRALTADTAEGGLETLERLAHDGGKVALVAADLHLPGWTASSSSSGHTRCIRVPAVCCSSPWTATTPGFPSANCREEWSNPVDRRSRHDHAATWVVSSSSTTSISVAWLVNVRLGQTRP